MLAPVTPAAPGRPPAARFPDRSAATPTAPEASATTWSSAMRATIASSISASETSTISSIRSRCSYTISPIPPAMPSASVGSLGYSRSGRPWRMDSGRAGEASGCTATMRTRGAPVFTPAATPHINPPQPAAGHGHEDGADVGQLVEDLEPDRSLAGGGAAVVEGVDVGRPGLLDAGHGEGVGVVIGRALQVDVHLERAELLHLGARRRLGHEPRGIGPAP